MDINRRDFLKLAGVAVGAIIIGSGEDLGSIEVESTPRGRLEREGRWKGWAQLGVPCAWEEKPRGEMLRVSKRYLKECLKDNQYGFKKYAGFKFILHPPSDGDPLMQRWTGGMTCYAK